MGKRLKPREVADEEGQAIERLAHARTAPAWELQPALLASSTHRQSHESAGWAAKGSRLWSAWL